MHAVPRRTLRACVWRQRRQAGVRLLERVAAPPQQFWLEALLAQILELVEVNLECALVPAQLAPERREMVEAARRFTPSLY
jgi:hypothetical protein